MNIQRTKIVLRESVRGLFFKLLAILLSFLMMPLMLAQLGSETLGAWLVLLSIFQWVTFFDLGVAAGAKNEIARAYATGSDASMRVAIATGWYYTLLIALSFVFLMTALLWLTPIKTWLKINAFSGMNIDGALWIVSLGACAAFAFNYIQAVYSAYQQSSKLSVFSLLTNIVFIGLIIAYPSDNLSGLTNMGWYYLLALISSNAWLIITFFYNKPNLIPRISSIDRKLKQGILGFGLKLFVIQLAALILFTTDRLMVSIFVGAADVVIFDAAFKIFSMVTMVHGLLMTALWSAFTHAKAQNDWFWISTTLRRLVLFMLPISTGCIILAYASPYIIKTWLSPDQVGPSLLYWLFALTTILTCWSNVFANFLNGIANIKIQLYTAVLAAILNVPLSYFFAVGMSFGVSGILMGTAASLMLFSLAGPVHVSKILKIELKTV
jgi:O-antigen/teichoic acid export membrane protein